MKTSDDIPPGPFSERELREQWNQQADEHSQWGSLDSSEQLAWAQLCAIAWDRNEAAELLQRRHPAPVPVSERLPNLSPDASDFHDGVLWWFKPNLGWRLGSREAIECLPYPTHWLPFHALPLPAGEEKV